LSPPLLGALPWRSGIPLGEVWLALKLHRRPGRCAVSGSAWTSEWWLRNLCLVECCPFLLGRKCQRLMLCAASGLVCSVCGVSVLASVHGLGTSVDVGAAALESSRGVSSLPAGADGSSTRVVRGLGAGMWCCAILVFGSFPYKLAVLVLGMSLNIPLYRFLATFSLLTRG
jgi:hypothetical protein